MLNSRYRIFGHKLACLFVVLLSISSSAGSSGGWNVTVSPSGAVRIESDRKEFGMLLPALYEDSWRGSSMTQANIDCAEVGDVCYGRIHTQSGARVACETRVSRIADGLHLAYKLTPINKMRLNSMHVGISIPVGYVSGGSYIIDDVKAEFPDKRKETCLISSSARLLRICRADGKDLLFKFASPTPVLVQDDRLWGQTFSI